jgi:hypothetical protein
LIAETIYKHILHSIEIPPLRMSLRSRKPPKEEFFIMKDNDEIKQWPSNPKVNKSGKCNKVFWLLAKPKNL